MKYTCASCTVNNCEVKERDWEKMPKNCPMRDEAYMEHVFEKYDDPKIREFYVGTKTHRMPGVHPLNVPRLRAVIDFCKGMGYKKIGLAFCMRFKKEAALYEKILRQHGLDVVSVTCVNGAINIGDLGCPMPSGCEFDAACNPLGQAQLLNEQNVEFNLVMGLCLGHDSLFLKAADAMSTVICIKDPATAHAPATALYLYDSYYKPIFDAPCAGEEEQPL